MQQAKAMLDPEGERIAKWVRRQAEAAPILDVLIEQLKDLAAHAEHCEKLNCSDCQRFRAARHALMAPFASKYYPPQGKQ